MDAGLIFERRVRGWNPKISYQNFADITTECIAKGLAIVCTEEGWGKV